MDAVRRCVLGCLPVPDVTRVGALSAADDHDGEDRISTLPDELLREVVSRLPIKDAARTAALSPRWRRVWHSTALVLYDAHLFPSSSEDARVAAIRRILAGHPCPLRTVHLVYCCFGVHERELDEWSRLLAAGGVQDLVFISQPPPVDMPLPADILRCTELRWLYLGFMDFPDTRDLPNGAGVLPHLREFVILNTCIESRDLDHMLASSPELETLGLVLQCFLFWLSMAVELAVVDAPCLERLIMWHTPLLGFDESDDATLGAHELQIEHTVIKADTKVSPSSMVPSVKILALKVNFSVSTEVRMLASSSLRSSGPIECVYYHIKKMVLHNLRGDISEIAFLKFITQRANELRKLTLVLPGEALIEVGQDQVRALAIPLWASKACMVLLVGPIVKRGWNFHRASDLSIYDPFLLEHEHEIFCLVKKGE
ncbi:hypothetical protein GQ55_5G257400 [Panicum hallii var. hallii]|uniref:F-box domain-containing protein n=1 Tax=Panicum hallii var. hallii TaxID=1504633 RepID=A0A2T7DK70_9POAL|nr:hypothetical protein GQ55_5G257400 [Panicum hallii var. hallii]